MFKAHELVVKMEKRPKYNRITDSNTDVNTDEEGLSQPRFDRLDIEFLSEAIVKDVISAYILIKSVKTICNAVEHLVVTKVK